MTVVVEGARVFDGIASEPIERGTIVIEGETIRHVGPHALPSNGDARRIDGSELFAMPGLVNMHVHVGFMYAPGDVQKLLSGDRSVLMVHAVRIASVLLSQGITVARDMGGPAGIPVAIRNAVNSGQILGPRLFTCGRPIVATGRHGFPICVEADGVDAVIRAARAELKAGADFIKLMASDDPRDTGSTEWTLPGFSREEIEAAFSEASRWGRARACHVMGRDAIGAVVDAGASIIDHGQYLDRGLAERLVHRDVQLVPTLSSYDRQTFHPRVSRGRKWAELHRPLIAGHDQAMRVAIDAGVRLLVGTDTVGCYAEEVDLLRQAGLSAHESLLACTRWPAEALGLGASHGALEPGRQADLVLLGSDPLQDPYALEDVRFVVQAGRVLDPKMLTYNEDVMGHPKYWLTPREWGLDDVVALTSGGIEQVTGPSPVGG